MKTLSVIVVRKRDSENEDSNVCPNSVIWDNYVWRSEIIFVKIKNRQYSLLGNVQLLLLKRLFDRAVDPLKLVEKESENSVKP